MAVVPALEGANTMALKSTDPYTKSTGTVASKITTYDANGLAANGTQSGYTYSFGNGADTYDFTANTGKITADWQNISGGNGSDYIKGSTFSDIIWGDSVTNSQTSDNGADTLFGGDGNDQIHGGNGADVLEGDKGADVLWGDRGGDTFKYVAVSDSSAKSTGGWSNVTGDVISDFNATEGDRIDLGALALTGAGGNMLTWSGNGVGSAHHVWTDGTYLYADTNGDSTADLAIKVSGITATSFIGVNHDPVVVAALTASTTEDAAAITRDLLAGASDSDVGDTANLSVTHVTYTTTINNVAATTPAGVSVSGSTLTVDTQNNAFDSLAQGETMKIVVSYDIEDGHGGVVHQTETVTITGANDDPSLTGTAATLAGGTEDIAYTVSAADLLAGYTDVDHGSSITVAGLSADHGSVHDNGDGTYTVTLDANYNGSVTLSYNVEDGNGGSTAATNSFSVAAVNDAPELTGTAATLTGGTEDTAYTVSASDLLTGFTDVENDTLSVASLSADHGSVHDNGDGTYTITLDANYNGSVTLSYNVEDGNGGSTAATNSFSVAAVNDAPTITSPNSGDAVVQNYAENGSGAVATIVASDVDSPTINYSLTGNDASLFSISSGGVLTFNASPNYEAPADSNHDNVYNVTVVASDGSLTDTQAFAITVTNVNEAPVITSPNSGNAVTQNYAENGTGAVATVVSTDPDGTTPGYTLTGNDASLFSISSGGVLTFNASPNFEAPADSNHDNVYNVTVVASDGSLNDTQTFAITVTDVNEDNTTPTDITFSLATGSGSAATQGTSLGAGNTIGTLGVVDTLSSSWTFAISSSTANVSFASGSALTTTSGASATLYVGTGGLTAGDYAFTITATDGGGNSKAEVFTVHVGGTAADTFSISAGTDLDFGLNGADIISGGGGDDALVGGAAGDFLNGGAGNDQLYGGNGGDTFIFDLKGTANADQVLDFDAIDTGGNQDVIQLAASAFSPLSAGALNAANFISNTTGTAGDANDYIVFNSTTGQLYYDDDGNGAHAAQLIATLTITNGTFGAEDFLIV